MTRARAAFVDRDGVLNDLVYNVEEGRVLSPFSVREMRVFPYVPETVRRLRDDLGFKVIVISNQPGVAKRQFTLAELGKMNAKLRREVVRGGASLDGEYYCLHHPNALIKKYRLDCDCRKPKPGLLLRAAKEHGIDMASSYFMGDSLLDIKAGKRAGCKTVFVGHLTSLMAKVMESEDAVPDYVIASLKEAPWLLSELGANPRPKTVRGRTAPAGRSGRRTVRTQGRASAPRVAVKGRRTASSQPVWTICSGSLSSPSAVRTSGG
ncbi:MAG: HAD family hydrolase [Thaumarchaeota archaeon]|nr:HAD family hydrolase [Nitrososphaerota archaeon]